MAQHQVNVLVEARDNASRKFKVIGTSALGMGNMIRKAAAMAVFYFGGRAIKRFAQESLELYGRQEQAVLGLRDALALLGPVTNEQIADYKKWAAEMQKATVYGDEQVLELAAMGAAMGKLSGDTLKDATVSAIGLSKAYGIELVGAMRLVARAAVGDTATLKRYGITLGEGLSSQEKFVNLMAIGAKNFKLAEGEARTYTGTVEQMKNALGDVKEAIGLGLMPVFKASAERIRDWAVRNQERIGVWAQKTVSALVFIKDGFAGFIKYLKEDWRGGLWFVMDSFLELLRGAFRAAIGLAILGGKGIWRGLKEALSDSAGHVDLVQKMLYENWGGKMRTLPGSPVEYRWNGTGFTGTPKNQEPIDAGLWQRMRVEAEKAVLEEQIEKAVGSGLDIILNEGKKTLEAILERAPAKLRENWLVAWVKHLARVIGMGKPGEPGTAGGGPAEESAGVAEKVTDGVRKALSPLEARFLTFAPGREFDYARQTAKNTQEQIRLLRESTRIFREIQRELEEANQRHLGTGYAETAFT